MSSVLPMFRSGISLLSGHAPGTGAASLPAKILLLHRDADSAAAVSEVTQAVPASVVTVGSVRELLEQADDRTYGCVLVDYAAFRSEVLAHIASFAKERPAFPFIVWSSQLEIPLGVEAMKWGAVDVLRKPLDNGALATVLQNALRTARDRFLRWHEYRAVVKQFGQLSASEKSVLSLVMQGRTNKEIASKLDCSLRTVEARRQRILRIMETENAIELAVVLARHGLMDAAVGLPVPAPAANPWGDRVSHVS
jgi:two-component system response regulator FixJ